MMYMHVIYQIHDFCVNNFHYHNVVDGDYRWCSHYQTLATAYEAAVAMVGRSSSADWDRTDDDCSGMMRLIRCSCSGDDNVDGIAAVDLMGSKSRLVSVAKRAPGIDKNHIYSRSNMAVCS